MSILLEIVIIAFLVIISYNYGALKGGNELIQQCEESLPRNETCELFARPSGE